MRIDLLAPTRASIEETVAFVRRAESVGAAGVGVPDHLEYGRDGFVALALAARAAPSIDLYPAVANVLTRHVFQLAVLARTMQEAAGERFKLVIGAGGSTAERTGQPPASRRRLREAVATIRALLAGEAVAFGTSAEELIEDALPPGPPVLLAVSGPKAVRLAGEIGDGALLFTGVSTPTRALAAELVAAGRAEGGRVGQPFETTYVVPVCVGESASEARERARGAAFNWLRLGRFDAGLERAGISWRVPESARALSNGLLAAICEHFFITGMAAECAARLEALSDAGAERVLLMPVGGADVTEAVLGVMGRVSAR
ncbi:MAG: LLM class flavin-dependent oxidoreductase [Dehalococcoidia bacterium]|nr:LLM class flavin-dependent oxidoreductase [Dehalococcoidia bacterium]